MGVNGWRASVLLVLCSGLALFPADLPAQERETQAPAEAAVQPGEASLSKKELRRRRRAARRAAREAGREWDQAAEAADAAEDAAEEKAEAASEQKRERASQKASGMAENLKGGFGAGLEAAAAMPGGAEAGTLGGTSPAGASGGLASPSGKGDPARPMSPGDFLLSVRSGYAPALERAGLRVGPDGKSLIRISDGRPAEAGDPRLKRAIEAMPAALAPRPDFFSEVSPEHFEAVKAGYHERPELGDTVFRHVAPTEKDRDLIHSQSCSKVSGGCNESVRRESYKKGEFVDPEDLERMWKSLEGEFEESDSEDGPARLNGPRKSGRRTNAAAPPSFLEIGDSSLATEGQTTPGGGGSRGGAAGSESKEGNAILRRLFGPASSVDGNSSPSRKRSWLLAVALIAAAGGLLLRKGRS